MSEETLQRLSHTILGKGTLVRIEGTDWIIIFDKYSKLFRFPANKRSEFQVCLEQVNAPIAEDGPNSETRLTNKATILDCNSQSNSSEAPISAVASATDLLLSDAAETLGAAALDSTNDPAVSLAEKPDDNFTTLNTQKAKSPSTQPCINYMNGCELNRWDYRRAIESLANGLPPVNGPVRQLAIGFEIANGLIQNFLSDVAAGGGAMIVKGSYGQGKTFALRCLQEIALEKNFMVAHTEVDATENRLSKPHHIYRDLIRHLHVPGQLKHGAAVLSRVTSDHLAKTLRQNTAIERARYLKQQLDCAPLTWLFSDPDILDKPALIGLLSCEPNIPIARARKTHQVQPTPQTWPAFSAGTQGDFASYLLSGIGCIAKMLGYKGLIIILVLRQS